MNGGSNMRKVFDTSPVMDKRTSDGFMNCEFPGYPSFEEFVRVGPLPKVNTSLSFFLIVYTYYWGQERAVKAMTVTDTLFNFLYTDSTLRERLIGQVTRVASSECELPEQELTTAEVENIRIHHLLLKLIAALAQNSKPSDPGFIASTVAQVQGWLRDKLSVISPPSPAELPGVMHLTPDTPSNLYAPSWLYLHGSITLLETLKAITLFTSIQRKSKRKSPSIPRENLEDLETLTKELGDVIKKNARSLKSQIAGAGMLGELVSTVTTGPKDALISYSTEIEQMIDTTSVELFCGSLMDSWDEALDGVNTCAA